MEQMNKDKSLLRNKTPLAQMQTWYRMPLLDWFLAMPVFPWRRGFLRARGSVLYPTSCTCTRPRNQNTVGTFRRTVGIIHQPKKQSCTGKHSGAATTRGFRFQLPEPPRSQASPPAAASPTRRHRAQSALCTGNSRRPARSEVRLDLSLEKGGKQQQCTWQAGRGYF